MLAALAAWSGRHVIALAANAEDQAFIPESCQSMRSSAMRDTVLLGKAEDRWHPAGELPVLDLATHQVSELLMQRDWRIVVQLAMAITRPKSNYMSATFTGTEQPPSVISAGDAAAEVAQPADRTEAHERRLP